MAVEGRWFTQQLYEWQDHTAVDGDMARDHPLFSGWSRSSCVAQGQLTQELPVLSEVGSGDLQSLHVTWHVYW